MRLLWVSALIFTVPSNGELMVSLNSQMSTCLYCHENLPYNFKRCLRVVTTVQLINLRIS